MDLNGIIAEMGRKPDEGFLLDWIRYEATSLDEAKDAIDAYDEALEDE